MFRSEGISSFENHLDQTMDTIPWTIDTVGSYNIFSMDEHLDYSRWDISLLLQMPSINTPESTSNALSPLVFKEFEHRTAREKRLKRKLREVFQMQFPRENFLLRKFYVENWPEGVELSKQHWTKSDIDKINERIPILKYRLREKALPLEMRLGLDKMKCLVEAELDPDLTYDSAFNIIHERFRAECACLGLFKVDWKLLDKQSIPNKYDEVELN